MKEHPASRLAVRPHGQQVQALGDRTDRTAAGLSSHPSLLVIGGEGFRSENLGKVSMKLIHVSRLVESLTAVNKSYAVHVCHSHGKLCSKRSGYISLERLVVASHDGMGKAACS